MPIIVNLDVVMAQRKVRLNDLAAAVGVTPSNLSILKTGKARAIRFSTLEAICRYLNCQPGEILCHIAETPGTGEPAGKQAPAEVDVASEAANPM